jgi:transcriptional regulator with XRE-family HTH domain
MADRYYERPRPVAEQAIVAELVDIRRDLGLKARDVARRLHLTPGAVSAFETSAKRGHSVTLERLLRYADAIGAEIHITPKGTR